MKKPTLSRHSAPPALRGGVAASCFGEEARDGDFERVHRASLFRSALVSFVLGRGKAHGPSSATRHSGSERFVDHCREMRIERGGDFQEGKECRRRPAFLHVLHASATYPGEFRKGFL